MNEMKFTLRRRDLTGETVMQCGPGRFLSALEKILSEEVSQSEMKSCRFRRMFIYTMLATCNSQVKTRPSRQAALCDLFASCQINLKTLK